jgi:hypothetical protein
MALVKIRSKGPFQRFDAAIYYFFLAALTIITSRAVLRLSLRVVLASLRLRGVNEYFRFIVLNRQFLIGCVGLSALFAIEDSRPTSRNYKKILFQCVIFILVAYRFSSRILDRENRQHSMPKGWDLPTVLTPNKCADVCQGKGTEWCATECTNAWGFRGNLPDIARTPKKTRVLLIGDSYVYGSGVKDAGRLDAALQEILMRRDPSRQWEVSNFALPGLNFYSYIRIAEAVVPKFRPDFIVIGFLKCNDLEEMDTLGDIEAYGKPLYRAALSMGIQQHLEMIERDRYACWRTKNNDVAPSDSITAKFDESLSRLLRIQKRFNFRLLVFSYFGPTPLFDRAQRDGELRVLSPLDPLWQFSNERLSIPQDGHPTAAGNKIFSQQLASEILTK